MDSITSVIAARLAHRLAGGGIRRGGYSGVFGSDQGASWERETALRPGPQIPPQLYSTNHRGRPVDVCAVSGRRADGASRRLVAAVRYRDCYGRGLLRASRTGYGAGYHGFRSDRAFRAV